MTTETHIITLEHQLIEAMKAGDVAQLDALLHDDLLFVIPNGQTVTKEADLDNFRKGLIQVDELNLEEIAIQAFTDTAISTTFVNMRGSFGGQPFQGQFKYLRVWKHFEGHWKVIGGAGIHLPAA